MVDFFLKMQEEHQILIVLYLMSYVSAMLIQIKDPKASVTFLDWIVAFLCSAVGGVLMFFGVMQWANMGVRMAATIIISLLSYRTILFVVDPTQQDEFAKGFWGGIKTILLNLFTQPPAKKKDDE